MVVDIVVVVIVVQVIVAIILVAVVDMSFTNNDNLASVRLSKHASR